MMKILFFMDVYIFGGCEKMLKETAEHLLAQGHQVDLLLIYRSESNTYLNQLDPRIGVKYIWDVDHKNNLVKRGVFWLNVLLPSVAASRVDVKGYDWVINFKDDYQTNLIAARLGAKKISWIHNITEDYQPVRGNSIKYKAADALYRKINDRYLRSFSRFDKVVCVSQHAQSTLEAHCPQPISSTVIYNYVDFPAVSKLAQQTVTDVSFDRFTYCYVGRLSAEKGVTELTEAACRLIRDGENGFLVKDYEELGRKMKYLYENRAMKVQKADHTWYCDFQNEFYRKLNELLNTEV